ncbi:MAG TPA: PTS N-acetyl-D-glucosamine transporter, partial [Caulobacteraceae bacterium]|nr:PTS N-acetyl-D-glucosamine transporter [Caulobacteraceae bacterium]
LSIEALGQALGAAIAAVEARASRVVVTLAEPRAVDEAALLAAGARAAVATAPDKVHLVVGPAAEQVAAGLKALIPA